MVIQVMRSFWNSTVLRAVGTCQSFVRDAPLRWRCVGVLRYRSALTSAFAFFLTELSKIKLLATAFLGRVTYSTTHEASAVLFMAKVAGPI